jgi:hypothetical protein
MGIQVKMLREDTDGRMIKHSSEARPLGRPRLRWVDNIRMDLERGGMG